MITDKTTFRNYIIADRLSNSIPVKYNFLGRLKQFIFPDQILKFLFLLRKSEYLKNCRKSMIGNVYFLYYYQKFIRHSRKLGFSIPLNVFGPGLSIPHYGTIVVNPKTKVGKNCRLHVCVNIGASGGSELAPKIGDNVYIGPGVIIFGNINIADNITIAANATVNKTIEIPNVTIGGTPARVLKECTTSWWIKNRLDLK